MPEAYEVQLLQDEVELDLFCKIIQQAGASSYLEIGAKFGGSLWRVAKSLKSKSRIVAVDLPAGTRAWPQSKPSLVACVAKLKELGHDARVVWGDSTAADVIAEVKLLGPFDVVFIDANHTAAFVRQDWANYGAMGKIVAFHDIAWRRDPKWQGMPIEVPAFWQAIKGGYQHTEISFDPKAKDNGIGVLWR